MKVRFFRLFLLLLLLPALLLPGCGGQTAAELPAHGSGVVTSLTPRGDGSFELRLDLDGDVPGHDCFLVDAETLLDTDVQHNWQFYSERRDSDTFRAIWQLVEAQRELEPEPLRAGMRVSVDAGPASGGALPRAVSVTLQQTPCCIFRNGTLYYPKGTFGEGTEEFSLLETVALTLLSAAPYGVLPETDGVVSWDLTNYAGTECRDCLYQGDKPGFAFRLADSEKWLVFGEGASTFA